MVDANSSREGEGNHHRWWKGTGLITKPRAVAPIIRHPIARRIEVLPCLACPPPPSGRSPTPCRRGFAHDRGPTQKI